MIVGVVRRTVERRSLLSPGDGVLVACSGGPDSVAMTHVLSRLKSELGLTLAVASIDHGLRPEGPDEVAGVRDMAKRLCLPFFTRRINLRDGADLHARARRARFEALYDLAVAAGATKISLGQHADDQAETVVSRLLRGSGLRGLAGVDPHREDGVIRPMIDCRRADIEAYVAKHQLHVVTDPSNDDPRFERARLRSEVMPLLEREDEQAVQHLARIAEECNEINKMLSSMASEILGEKGSYPASLPVVTLRAAPPPVRLFVIREWLQDRVGQPPSRAHLVGVLALMAAPGEVWLPQRWTAGVLDGHIVLKQTEGHRT